jgi:hypothetical protein
MPVEQPVEEEYNPFVVEEESGEEGSSEDGGESSEEEEEQQQQQPQQQEEGKIVDVAVKAAERVGVRAWKMPNAEANVVSSAMMTTATAVMAQYLDKGMPEFEVDDEEECLWNEEYDELFANLSANPGIQQAIADNTNNETLQAEIDAVLALQASMASTAIASDDATPPTPPAS